MTTRDLTVAVAKRARRRHLMLERWETRGERGYTTGYVTKETSHQRAAFSRAPRPRQAESPVVDGICIVVGIIMLAATVALFWIMATAT